MKDELDETVWLVTPELDDIPEDDSAEPDDAEVLHHASVEEVDAVVDAVEDDE